jgi:FlaG/FlaF family flagellin (archaellin)
LHPNWGTGRAKPTGNTKGVKKMRKTRKIRENKKGIDTILAALLMVVIVVVAAVMVYAWATGLLGTLLVHPTTGQENLSLENCTPTCSFSSSTNATLSLRNLGSVNITLASYFVKDSNGNQYARSSWNAGPISPNTAKSVFIVIGTTCGSSCTLTGSAFTYTSGFSYTVTVITTRNNQFTFTITR